MANKITRTCIICGENKSVKLETYFLSLLDSYFPNEWKYVGDGQVIIDGKCPDFINVNGKKEIIETYGNYWHRNDNPQDRIDKFAKFGYKTLVIWENELQDTASAVSKIKNTFYVGGNLDHRTAQGLAG